MRNDNRAVIAIKSRSLIIPFHLKTNCFRQIRGEPFKVLIKASDPYRKTYSSFVVKIILNYATKSYATKQQTNLENKALALLYLQ